MRTLGTLFSGIDCFAFGLASAGWRLKWGCEIEEFPRSVWRKRFPDAQLFGDVRELKNPPKVDGLAFGFPCQDLSLAGLGAGLKGAKSGLWTEGARIIGEVEPEVVFIENVKDLLYRGMEKVVEDLTELGYAAEWDVLPACYFGAPHIRQRVWIVAYRGERLGVFGEPQGLFPYEVTAPGSEGWLRWPRAGFAEAPGQVLELEPLAPMSGAGGGRARALWPQYGADFIPTPTAKDAGHTSVEMHLRQKMGWDSALRSQITSLAVLAKNDMRAPTPEQLAAAVEEVAGLERTRELWPTATANRGRRSTARQEHWASNPGETLLDAAIEEEAEMWPTPTQGTGHMSGSNRDVWRPGLEEAARIAPEGPPPKVSAEKHRGMSRDEVREALAAEREQEMWPTPTAQDGKNNGGPSQYLEGDGDPESQIRLWPTPRATESEGRTYSRTPSQEGGQHGKYLQVEAIEAEYEDGRLERPDFPTPTASGRDNTGGSNSRAAAKANGTFIPGQLCPEWVEWLMGLPMGYTDPQRETASLVPHGWESEPPGVPRITSEKGNRVSRVTALGNALVHQCAAWLGARYNERKEHDG